MRHILRATESAFVGLSALCTAGFLVVVVLQVVYRYILELPLTWSEEAARSLFVWAAFLAAAVCLGRQNNFSIAIIADALQPRMRRVLEIVGVVLTLVFTLLMIRYGFTAAWRFRWIRSPVLPISQGLIYSVIPLAGLYGLVHLLPRLVAIIKDGSGHPPSPPTVDV